ncbi:lectin subunit alpha-like isoform X1 [Dendroctonus ponderosae]|uniref:lectin subunit alpha-like isoform X1 n=1 Tax=Dendroctonus ponderosae TaxID=77166 RepID=UPI0020350F0F|nr:lectin subunit alpha-like isoform X1 [Dendroctonus ponderosae]KAH1025203.1 hypothetical protein HUJ05_009975 [Dendroctonus ponderosae]
MYSTKAFDSLLLLISSIKYISALATMPVAFSDSNYVVTTLPVTWSEAYVLCQQNGMNLVSIKSAEEQDALAKALSFYGSPGDSHNRYWTAGRRFGRNSFVWFTDGEPLVYNNFAHGEPNNLKGAEGCIEFVNYSKKTSKWNDIACSKKAGYVCQVRNVLCQK